jgi:hypothetical protein
MHADAPTHETADSVLLKAPFGLGLCTIDHAEPFQNSVRVTETDLLFVYDPTATHCDALAHEIPLSPAKVAPFGVGVLTIDHTEPFHDSARGQVIRLLSV